MKYRKELEQLMNVEDIVVIGKVVKRGSKLHTSKYGNQYPVDTMLLDEVRCCIIKDNKLHIKVRLDHIWLSGEQSKIVNNFKIKPGHEVRFFADVIEYKYKNGTKQLGLIDNNKIKAMFK